MHASDRFVSRTAPRVDPKAVLAVVAVAQFMVVLDATVVNVALPTIKRDVGFTEGPKRNHALAVWGAVAGAGGAVGLLLGGVIVQALSWRWVFLINVPIGAAVLALAPRLVPESRSESATKGGYDAEGALTITL